MVRSQARQQERRRLSEHVGFQLLPIFLLISFDVQDVVIDVHDFRVCSRTHKNQWKMKGFIPQLGLALGFLLILCKGIGDRLVAGRRVPRVPREGSSTLVIFGWFRGARVPRGFPRARVPRRCPWRVPPRGPGGFFWLVLAFLSVA